MARFNIPLDPHYAVLTALRMTGRQPRAVVGANRRGVSPSPYGILATVVLAGAILSLAVLLALRRFAL